MGVARPTLRRGKDRILGGVCSGLAEYFDVDPIFVRIAFVILAVLPPAPGVLIYLVLWVIMPAPEGMPASAGLGSRIRAMGDDMRGLGQNLRHEFSSSSAATHDPSGPATSPAATVPPRPETTPSSTGSINTPSSGQPRRPWRGMDGRERGLWLGGILILLGIYFLGVNLGLFSWWRWELFWPIVLISIGLFVLVRRMR